MLFQYSPVISLFGKKLKHRIVWSRMKRTIPYMAKQIYFLWLDYVKTILLAVIRLEVLYFRPPYHKEAKSWLMINMWKNVPEFQ